MRTAPFAKCQWPQRKKGLELLGITDHGPAFPGALGLPFFGNMKALDRDDYDVQILFGAELNILDESGKTDYDEKHMASLDLFIASLHLPCFEPVGKAGNTAAVVNAMKDPRIHIIGHLEEGRYPMDYDAIAKEAKETNTLIEINNSSLAPNAFRINAEENCIELLAACEKYGVCVVINSDAHVDTYVGNHQHVISLLEKINFPEALIVNSDTEKFLSFLKN